MKFTGLVAHFNDGSVNAVEEHGDCPQFTVGLSTRGDGYRRVIFYQPTRYTMAPDPWLKRLTKAEHAEVPF